METFMIRFFICNLILAGLILLFSAVRHLLADRITQRMQYLSWFPLLFLLFVPFFPSVSNVSGLFSATATSAASDDISAVSAPIASAALNFTSKTRDFCLSVSHQIPLGIKLSVILWAVGILFMLLRFLHTQLDFRKVADSALPVQNKKTLLLYKKCLSAMGIKRQIPLYSTAFLSSPVTAGPLFPRIYLPIRILSECTEKELRCMLLHELQHCRHKDCLVNFIQNLALILYWFNPAVWFLVKQIRTDCEIACDSSVLDLLGRKEYRTYGSSLISLAEQNSLQFFQTGTGMGGSKKQIHTRILNISAYRSPSRRKKRISSLLLLAAVIMAFTVSPFLSVYAFTDDTCTFSEDYLSLDATVSSYFIDCDGSFVLYDQNADKWLICNAEDALLRSSPDSTYKIYSALFALENESITPSDSSMEWDQTSYPFDEWNRNQDLNTAMANSVNWYFQTLDQRTGLNQLQNDFDCIHYGNCDLSGGLSSYWQESSLKISPVEQVALLAGTFGSSSADTDPAVTTSSHFSNENLLAVKNSLLISSSPERTLYGKTGTGSENGTSGNGWFIGFLEENGNTYFFATHLKPASGSDTDPADPNTDSVDSDAVADSTGLSAAPGSVAGSTQKISGSTAADLTFSILNDLGNHYYGVVR